MDMGDNWQIHAPWAQLVASTVVPPNLFKNALEIGRASCRERV